MAANVYRHVLLAIALLCGLASCGPKSTFPLAMEDQRIRDTSLEGHWVMLQYSNTEDIPSVIELRYPPKGTSFVIGPDGEEQLTGFATTIGKRRFVCIPIEDAFVSCEYRVSGRFLRLKEFDSDAAKQAVESGRIAGKVSSGGGVLIQEPTKELRSVVSLDQLPMQPEQTVFLKLADGEIPESVERQIKTFREAAALARSAGEPLLLPNQAVRAFDRPSDARTCLKRSEQTRKVEVTDAGLRAKQSQIFQSATLAGRSLLAAMKIDGEKPSDWDTLASSYGVLTADEDTPLLEGAQDFLTLLRRIDAQVQEERVHEVSRSALSQMHETIYELHKYADRNSRRNRFADGAFALDFNEAWAMNHKADTLALTNTTGVALRDCVVMVRLYVRDDFYATNVHGVERWAPNLTLTATYPIERDHALPRTAADHVTKIGVWLWTASHCSYQEIRYDRKDWHADIASYLAGSSVKLGYLDRKEGLLGSVGRGVKLVLDGPIDVPGCEMRVRFQRPGRQLSLSKRRKTWSRGNGYMNPFTIRDERWNFRPEEVQLELWFPEGDFVWHAGTYRID